MDNPVQLNAIEEQELQDGQALYEMTKTTGFQVLKRWLEDMAFHSWIDPREINSKGGPSEEEWKWRELNAFHAANNARELMERIQKAISQADYLDKKRHGEIKIKSFKV